VAVAELPNYFIELVFNNRDIISVFCSLVGMNAAPLDKDIITRSFAF